MLGVSTNIRNRFNKFIKADVNPISSLRLCQHIVSILSLAHVQHRQDAFMFEKSFFFMYLSNLKVKSSITKIIENNIFEGTILYRFV